MQKRHFCYVKDVISKCVKDETCSSDRKHLSQVNKQHHRKFGWNCTSTSLHDLQSLYGDHTGTFKAAFLSFTDGHQQQETHLRGAGASLKQLLSSPTFHAVRKLAMKTRMMSWWYSEVRNGTGSKTENHCPHYEKRQHDRARRLLSIQELNDPFQTWKQKQPLLVRVRGMRNPFPTPNEAWERHKAFQVMAALNHSLFLCLAYFDLRVRQQAML